MTRTRGKKRIAVMHAGSHNALSFGELWDCTYFGHGQD